MGISAEKKRIEHSFSRAAATYDRFAIVQEQASRILLSSIWEADFGKILEIGCGTGNYTKMLLDTFDPDKITSVDLSGPMIRRAGERLGAENRVRFIQADGEALPADVKGPFDLVTSSGTMQWFQDFQGSLNALAGLLSPGGTACFSIFGPGTLRELQEAVNVYTDTPWSLPAVFFPGRDAITAWLGALFNRVVSREHMVTLEYPDLYSLLKVLRSTGTAPKGGQGTLITGPACLRRLEEKYIQIYGAVSATYEILIFKAWEKRQT